MESWISSALERRLRGNGLPRGVAALVAVGLVGSAIIAITAATAIPQRGRPAHAATIVRQTGPASALLSANATVSPSARTDQNEVEAQRFTGRVGENLSSSLLAAGVPELQGRQYVAILSHAIPLAGGLSVDDRFDLVLQREPDGKLGQLLYVGLDRIARADVELLKWTDGKNLIWLNADGVGGEDRSRLGLPVHGRLTSGFGERFHPILGHMRFHKGVDLAAAAGTPIVAAADGRVIGAGWHGGYGRQVEIAHQGGTETSYGHMSRIAARIGQVVRKGEVIGWVGSTGLSTGPHLHFEVTHNGKPLNPMSAKLGNGPGHLEGEKLREFQGGLRSVLLGSSSRG